MGKGRKIAVLLFDIAVGGVDFANDNTDGNSVNNSKETEISKENSTYDKMVFKLNPKKGILSAKSFYI